MCLSNKKSEKNKIGDYPIQDTHSVHSFEKLQQKGIKISKPNILKRIAYKLGIAKDPRFDGAKFNWFDYDEFKFFN